MTIDLLLTLGIVAGILQLLGYLFYISNESIEPQPVTWFMFAYGTAILAILEWDGEATLPELLLPSVCALFAIYVSYLCWKKARRVNPHKWWPEDWWPEDRGEQISFVSDILITILYIGAWALAAFEFVNGQQREFAVLTFLFLSNISTLPAFYPILRETFLQPKIEHWLPWLVWTAAYVILAITTYLTHGAFWHPLMFYPVINALLHCAMALVATGYLTTSHGRKFP